MFEKQKEAIRKEVAQELRIEQLEDIICPNGQHTWIEIETSMGNPKSAGFHQYLCKKCKKKKTEYIGASRVERVETEK